MGKPSKSAYRPSAAILAGGGDICSELGSDGQLVASAEIVQGIEKDIKDERSRFRNLCIDTSVPGGPVIGSDVTIQHVQDIVNIGCDHLRTGKKNLLVLGSKHKIIEYAVAFNIALALEDLGHKSRSAAFNGVPEESPTVLLAASEHPLRGGDNDAAMQTLKDGLNVIADRRIPGRLAVLDNGVLYPSLGLRCEENSQTLMHVAGQSIGRKRESGRWAIQDMEPSHLPANGMEYDLSLNNNVGTAIVEPSQVSTTHTYSTVTDRLRGADGSVLKFLGSKPIPDEFLEELQENDMPNVVVNGGSSQVAELGEQSNVIPAPKQAGLQEAKILLSYALAKLATDAQELAGIVADVRDRFKQIPSYYYT